jgi:hypothetical protein
VPQPAQPQALLQALAPALQLSLAMQTEQRRGRSNTLRVWWFDVLRVAHTVWLLERGRRLLLAVGARRAAQSFVPRRCHEGIHPWQNFGLEILPQMLRGHNEYALKQPGLSGVPPWLGSKSKRRSEKQEKRKMLRTGLWTGGWGWGWGPTPWCPVSVPSAMY